MRLRERNKQVLLDFLLYRMDFYYYFTFSFVHVRDGIKLAMFIFLL